MIGITGYGTYIPFRRIALGEIARVWQKDEAEIVKSLGITEKSVPSGDEDAVTIAYEAAVQALVTSGISPTDIGVLFVGSESHPYAVNPTSTIVGELAGLGHDYLAADFEFACKAATAAIQAISGLIEAGRVKAGMAIGSDTAQSKPHDVLEYTSAAAGVAMTLGSRNIIAQLLDYCSYSSDTPDFWRRDGMRFPSHAGRFTGEPAYFTHVMGAAGMLFKKADIRPEQIDYCVFHMPNGKFPRDVGRRLGFTADQLADSLTVDRIGNPYSASSLLGLSAVFDVAGPGKTIFMVSYGSGAGSDAFLWKTTPKLSEIQKRRQKSDMTVASQIGKKENIDYAQYLKQTHKI